MREYAPSNPPPLDSKEKSQKRPTRVHPAFTASSGHNNIQLVNLIDYPEFMKEISASKFKEQSLSLLDHLNPEGIVVTKHGKAVARVIPGESGCAALIGSMKGKVKVSRDVFSTGIKWNAEP
jgi:antitoxin (DNA-binding transcriptional repressor) of toxin-antitoxin stability system